MPMRSRLPCRNLVMLFNFMITRRSSNIPLLFALSDSITEPPSFTKKIENVTTVLKTSATFQSTVAGAPPISITWLKDDHILNEDDNVHISFVNNVATLQIRAVDNGHSGRYTCQAKNESGIERCYAFLLVQGL